eukprot:356704-Chlamydomonas_euryale.AAC.2
MAGTRSVGAALGSPSALSGLPAHRHASRSAPSPHSPQPPDPLATAPTHARLPCVTAAARRQASASTRSMPPCRPGMAAAAAAADAATRNVYCVRWETRSALRCSHAVTVAFAASAPCRCRVSARDSSPAGGWEEWVSVAQRAPARNLRLLTNADASIPSLRHKTGGKLIGSSMALGMRRKGRNKHARFPGARRPRPPSAGVASWRAAVGGSRRQQLLPWLLGPTGKGLRQA